MKLTEIKQKLKERKITIIGIARSLGVSHTAVCLTMKGTSKSARITKAIEDAISQPIPDTSTKEETV